MKGRGWFRSRASELKSKSRKRKRKSSRHTNGIIPRTRRTAMGETLFNIEDYLRDRYFIRGLIGQGGYGEIYLALDTKETLDVAIKAEYRTRHGKTSKRMILEQSVLLRLQGRPHVPEVYASGREPKINFIVMELLSMNLGELKRQAPFRRLGRSTVGRILMQAIAALRDIHAIGYIHRDIKPANMCFGITPSKRHVLIIVDFGLVRRFRNSDGTLRRPRKKVGFRGTLRYVSCRVHDRMEQSPLDDLISLVYSGIELLLSELPWKFMTKFEDVRNAKEELLEQIDEPESYLSLLPKGFQSFCREILSMKNLANLNYTFLQSFLTGFIGNRSLSDLYDWETGYEESLEPSTFSSEISYEDRRYFDNFL